MALQLNLDRVENFNLYEHIGSDNCYGQSVRWLREHPIFTAILLISTLGTIIGSIWFPSPLSFTAKAMIALGALSVYALIGMMITRESTRQEIALNKMEETIQDIERKNHILQKFTELKQSMSQYIKEDLPVIRTKEPLLIPYGPLEECMSFFDSSSHDRTRFTESLVKGFYCDVSLLTTSVTLGCREGLDGYETPFLMLKSTHQGSLLETMTIFPNLDATDPKHFIMIHKIGVGHASINLHLKYTDIQDFVKQVILGTHPEYILA